MATCQSYGNNSDPERFSTLPVVSLDADEYSSTSSNNGFKNLHPTYTTGYPYQPQQLNEPTCKNKTADISVTHAHWQALTLNSGDSQQDEFRIQSLNSTDDFEEKSSGNSEIIIYENQSKQDSMSCNDNVNKEKTSPVAVSESDDEDNNENDVSLLPFTHNNDDNAKATMLMASHFTTSGMNKLLCAYTLIYFSIPTVTGYRQVPTATVIYSVCF